MAELWASTGAIWQDMLLAEALVLVLFLLPRMSNYAGVL